MREWHSTVTTKGQVTIPIEIRRLLGVHPHDRVAFVAENGWVRLTRPASVVQQTAGAVRSNQRPLTAEELREAAEHAIAEAAVERTGN